MGGANQTILEFTPAPEGAQLGGTPIIIAPKIGLFVPRWVIVKQDGQIVHRLTWELFANLPMAIRQCQHVASKEQKERQQLRAAIKTAQTLHQTMRQYTTGKSIPKTEREFARLYERLKEYASSTLAVKSQSAQKAVVLKQSGAIDSRQRFNPGRTAAILMAIITRLEGKRIGDVEMIYLVNQLYEQTLDQTHWIIICSIETAKNNLREALALTEEEKRETLRNRINNKLAQARRALRNIFLPGYHEFAQKAIELIKLGEGKRSYAALALAIKAADHYLSLPHRAFALLSTLIELYLSDSGHRNIIFQNSSERMDQFKQELPFAFFTDALDRAQDAFALAHKSNDPVSQKKWLDLAQSRLAI